MQPTRRAVLRAGAAGAAASLAGCLDVIGASEPTGGGPRTIRSTDSLPTSDASLYVPWEPAHLRSQVRSGGPGKDGIPSIDDPVFAEAGTADVADDDVVFGVARNGDARAYPQRVLVWHEIVNDVVGGDPVAVTYCPLTGTAMGFERGGVEFGVSGNLLNSNLVMYDRASDSRWPQVLGTAVEGALAGESLQEFRVVWTTWERWRSAHPDTRVLTEDTGYIRQYDDDPYGDYGPPRGYYASRNLLFPALSRDDRAHPKAVVVGTRSGEGALAFRKAAVLESGAATGTLAGVEHVAVAESDLETTYVYANPDGIAVTPEGDGYRVDGETHPADGLPLDRRPAFDAMWFAWAGFYPETTYVE